MLRSLTDKRIQLIIIVLLTTLAYINIFRNEFVIDDKTFIVDWQTKNSFANILEFFRGAVPPGHEGVYRPLRSLLYALDWQIFGAAPFGYHLQAIIVHLTATVLVYLIVETLISAELKRRLKLMPFVAAALFGLHPIHTETITYIASSVETIGVVFFLGSFYLYLYTNGMRMKIMRINADGRMFLRIGSAVLATLAYFTSEITLTLPLLIVLFDFCFKNINKRNLGKRLILYTPYFFGALIYVFIRFVLADVGARGPYLADSVYLTALTMFKVFSKYLSLLILPLGQANNHVISRGIEAFVYRNYRTEAIRAQSIADMEILVAIVFLLILLVAAFKVLKKQPIFSFGVAWFFITLLPVSEIVPQGSILNEKFLYLPSFGFVLVAAYYLSLFLKSNYRYLTIGFLVVFSVIYFGLTVRRNFDWHDGVRLWSRDVALYPEDNAYGYFQLGNAYAGFGQADLAINNYQRAFEINPNFVVTLGSIAKVYQDLGRVDLAVDFYKRSLEIDPGFWEAHNNLANIYIRRADFDLAAREYEQILAVLPQFTQVQQSLQSLPKVVEATKAAATSSENVWLAYHNLGRFSLKVPAIWQVSYRFPNVVIFGTGDFVANISLERKKPSTVLADYLKQQKDNWGTLVNEGPALVPGYDQAYVKIWKMTEGADNGRELAGGSTDADGVTKLQFYLFKGEEVIKVLAYPGDSPSMAVFEIVMGSLRID